MGADEKKIANFLYEAGQLKRVARSGWWTAGIKHPESVAEHSWRSAVLGYLLAKRANMASAKGAGAGAAKGAVAGAGRGTGAGAAKGAGAEVDAERVALMCLFHDLPEARVGDTHKIAARYLDSEAAEVKAAEGQAGVLPEELGRDYLELIKERMGDKSLEAGLARDADLLECAMQGIEYGNDGFRATGDWVKRAGMQLATAPAKELFKEITAAGPSDWWAGLKKEPQKR